MYTHFTFLGIAIHCSIVAYKVELDSSKRMLLCLLPNCTEELQIFWQKVINTYYKDNCSTN